MRSDNGEPSHSGLSRRELIRLSAWGMLSLPLSGLACSPRKKIFNENEPGAPYAAPNDQFLDEIERVRARALGDVSLVHGAWCFCDRW